MTDKWERNAGIRKNEDGTISKVSPYDDSDLPKNIVETALEPQEMPEIPEGTSEKETKRIIRESLILRAGRIAHVSGKLKDIMAVVNSLAEVGDIGLPMAQLNLINIINNASGHTTGIPSSHTIPNAIEDNSDDDDIAVLIEVDENGDVIDV